jgi:hypothetical protein
MFYLFIYYFLRCGAVLTRIRVPVYTSWIDSLSAVMSYRHYPACHQHSFYHGNIDIILH